MEGIEAFPIAAIAALLVGLIIFIRGLTRFTKGGRNRSVLILILALTLSTMLATFGVVFSLIDLLDSLVAGDFVKERLLLKVSIFLIAFKLFQSLFKLLKRSTILKTIRDDFQDAPIFSKKVFKKLSLEEWNAKLKTTKEEPVRALLTELRNFSQLAVFQATSVVLLVQYVNTEEGQEETLFFSIINWALFFVLDDWNIMHEYSQKFNGNILHKHRRKIWGVNTILVICGPLYLVSANQFSDPTSAIVALFFIAVLVFNYYWRHYLDFNKYVPEPKKKKGEKEATQTA